MRPHEQLDAEIVDPDQTDAREVLSDRLAGLWWTFVLRGILAGAIGIAALFWPTDSISLLLQLVGVLLLLDGALTLFGLGRKGAAGGVGVGTIVIGLVLLIWPEGTARITFVLLGTWALIIGIGSLITWWQMPEWDPERSTARGVGLLASLVGLVLIFWPGSGLVALGWAIAFAALAVAVVMFWLATRFKRANERLQMRVVNR
ncbi:HdeD family acid-resistance protein [Aliiruegeria lutimaris]|uniref:Uncharacterized membrane protein HdeD, DUF308 family n=1 Tax=Aliiruegeria lutimaris TaxID=571298 RepID=A0A1G9NH73_9RHOB|nr:DUF308 domain-containing protein [Aliiruegeria lutimaris]SDL85285.1 Uncharacterized membrane protein HdeD, DUF308 family [Aliiruegeria lutimaris]